MAPHFFAKIGPIGPIRLIKRKITLLALALLFVLALPVHSSQGEASIIMDAHSGRVLHLDNPVLAVETAFPPGSLLKMYAALYGLRENIISPARTLQCKGAVIIGGRRFECWQPAGHGPLNFYKALAYSCNIYFYHYGREVDGAGFLEFLRRFGFGETTGIDSPNEAAGKLPQRLDRAGTVKLFAGLTRQMEITPIQAAVAFAALVNGGKRVRPYRWGGEKKSGSNVSDLNMSQYLPLVRRGLTEASIYGTCAGYNELAGGYAKTGTAPWVRGFHTHGWFAGYVPVQTTKGLRHFVVLVFKLKGTGAKDALPAGLKLVKSFKRRTSDKEMLTVSLFSLLKPKNLVMRGRLTRLHVRAGENQWRCRKLNIAFSRLHGLRLTIDGGQLVKSSQVEISRVGERGELELQAGSSEPRVYPGTVSVRGNGNYLEVLNRMTMAAYLRGVIGNEMGNSKEALKAQAVVSRTYALQNLERHGAFDFCDTTHCQHYTGDSNNSPEVTEAVAQTMGEVLTFKGNLCDVFYHSTCGGRTGGFEGVWNDQSRPYLAGIGDGNHCQDSPHFRWTFAVKPERLFKALEPFAGRQPVDLETTLTVAGGWVKLMSLIFRDGSRKKMRGEEFHIRMGREFGWNTIKSANFVIEKSKERWIFVGRGLGHGVGLCQWGAFRLSQQGKTYPTILQTYFPRTTTAIY